MPELTDLTAVVTGAASGLGRALAERFVAEGVRAVALLDRDGEGAEAVAAPLRAAGCQALALAVDVTDAGQVGEAIGRADQDFGGLDVVVNNAGILSPAAKVHATDVDDLRRVLEVNVVGVFNGLHAALAVMRPRGRGSIINTASVSGLTAWSHAAPYCASKAAVISLTKVAAVEVAREGIRVNCVCPGTFRSAIHEGMDDEVLAGIARRHPVGRLGEVGEVTGAYVYLAGPGSTWTTGSALVVDGGYSAP